jgi:hypothetical protein
MSVLVGILPSPSSKSNSAGYDTIFSGDIAQDGRAPEIEREVGCLSDWRGSTKDFRILQNDLKEGEHCSSSFGQTVDLEGEIDRHFC